MFRLIWAHVKVCFLLSDHEGGQHVISVPHVWYGPVPLFNHRIAKAQSKLCICPAGQPITACIHKWEM